MARNSRRAETRIGDDARKAATGRLDTALREGRLDLAEYERRLVVIQAAKVGKDLAPAVVDLPVQSGQTDPGLRISTADREHALVRLADALTDGRIEAAAYAGAEELLHRAVTYADVDAVVGNLDAKASVAEREQAIARIEAAVAGGQLEPADRDARVAAARSAATDAQLAALTADLSAATRSSGAPLRASNADREAVAVRLQEAVDAGFLDLTEFDERVRAVYAARLRDELTMFVADLPEPAPPLPQSPPVRVPPARKAPRTVKSVLAVLGVTSSVGSLVFLGGSVALGTAGFNFLAVSLIVVWLIGLAVVAIWARRAAKVAIEAEFPLRRTPRKAKPAPSREEEPPVERRSEESRHKAYIRALTCLVLPDGTPVAISGAQDNTAMVWDLATNSHRHTLSGHTHDVKGVAAMVLPDGSPVTVTVSGDGTARVWDLRDGSQRGTLPNPAEDTRRVACLTLADGTPVAVTHNLTTIQTWDLRDLSLRHDISTDLFLDAMVPAVLLDGMPLAVAAGAGDYAIDLVNLRNGRTRSRLLGHTDLVWAIDTTVLPDGTRVAASVGEDKVVRVWDLRRGKLMRAIAGMITGSRSVACSHLPDGTPIVVSADEDYNTRAWRLQDGVELETHGLPRGPLAALALPDRTLIVGLTEDGHGVATRPLK